MPRRRSTAAPAPNSKQARDLRARGQQTRRRLLDAGVDVFATRGYHTARVDDIVKVAKTSHGTFYLYFSNKEDLFRALTEAESGASEFGRLGTGVLAEFTRVLIDRLRPAAPADVDPVVASLALV